MQNKKMSWTKSYLKKYSVCSTSGSHDAVIDMAK